MASRNKRSSNGKMAIIKSHQSSNPAGRRNIIKLKRPPEPEVIIRPDHESDDYVIANGTDKLLKALFYGA